MTPNAFSYLTLVLALPIGIAMFVVLRPTLAAIVVYLSFTMFLPEVVSIDAPGLPGMGKLEVASAACVLGLLLVGRRRVRAARPFRGPEALVLLLFLGDIGTVVTNADVLSYGPTVLPGLTANEVVSLTFAHLLWYAVPFFVGRALITNARELRLLMVAIAVAGVIYTPFLFIELMLSPQLHNWVYGFHQHAFDQTMRGGGFRPMVFMTHGLAVGLLMAWAVMAAAALSKARRAVFSIPAPLVTLYNFGFLAVCKSVGALLYTLALAPLLMLATPRAVARVAWIAGILVITYPACRATETFPVQPLMDAARSLSAERAQSLGFRLEMEELIADHAAQRPLFGWGRFQRNMVFDPEWGRALSVSDGHWIIIYSVHGLFGFACIFLLIVWPLLVLRRRLRRIEEPADRALLAGLGIIVAVAAVDLIPNGLFTPLTVFFAGALYGAARALATSVVASSPPDGATEAA